MTSLQILGLATAAALVLWPQIKFLGTHAAAAAFSLFATKGVAGEETRPVVATNFRDAIAHLAQVRSRLLATDGLGDEQKKAIETLTLALVAGSDE